MGFIQINTPTIWEMNFFRFTFSVSAWGFESPNFQGFSIAAFWLEILKRKFRKSMSKAFSKTAIGFRENGWVFREKNTYRKKRHIDFVQIAGLRSRRRSDSEFFFQETVFGEHNVNRWVITVML